MSNYCKSLLVYWGNKYKLLGQIFQLIPKNINNFFDVFGGSGALSWNVWAKNVHYNEFSEDVYLVNKYFYENDYSKLEQEIKEVLDKFNLTNGKWESQRTYKKNNDEEGLKKLFIEIEKYRKMQKHFLENERKNPIYIYIQHQLSAFKKLDDIENNTFGARNLRFEKVKVWKDFLANKKIYFYNKDCIDFLNSFDFLKDDFIYLDPPYIATDTHFYAGGYDLKKEKQLFDKLDQLTKNEIKWALSNVYNNNNNQLINWINDNNYKINRLDALYIYGTSTSINYVNKNHDEILITNYDCGDHTFRFEQLSFF